MKAFLLEDDSVLSSEILFYLNAHAIDCVAAADGKTFLDRAFKEKFDVYILDINVPLVNGLDVCKKYANSMPERPSS